MIKTFEAVFDKNNRGVYSISLVEDPAMEGNFIALSKQKKLEFQAVDDEKRILVGLVLEPNKPIYRNQDGEEFNIVFSEQTITDLMYNFQKQGYQTNSSIEHEDEITGVSFVEQWQVRDENMDTAVSLGLKPKKGSWVAVMKCDNDEIYQKAKAGEVKGFSIDAFLTLKEIKLNSNKQMETKEEIKTGFAKLTDTLMTALNLKKEVKEEVKEVKLGSVKSQDGSVEIMYEGETPEVGLAVWVDDGQGGRVPLEAGEVALDDGRVLVVGDDSLIAEIKDGAEPAPAEEELNTEAPAALPNQATVDAIKSVLIKYSEEMDVKLKAITDENVKLKAEVVELSEQPASKPIKSVVEQKSKGLTQFLNNKL